MFLKYCPRCGKVMPYGKRMCEECFEKYPDIRKNFDRYYNKFRRNKKTDMFYHSKEWKTLSKIVLARAEYRCADCGGLAVEVHHKKPVAEYWEERLNIDNLEPLCTACHNKRRD